MTTNNTTRTPAVDLKGGDVFCYRGEWVEVFDTHGTQFPMMTVRYLVGSEVHSVRVARTQHVNRRVA